MPKRQVSVRPMAQDAIDVLASQIREARTHFGWTQAETAAQLRVSVGTYAAIEAGAAGTSIAHVFNAAELLGVPLFTPTPEELARLRNWRAHVDALIPQRVVPRDEDIDDDF